MWQTIKDKVSSFASSTPGMIAIGGLAIYGGYKVAMIVKKKIAG